jgi:hypothetical protein
MQHSTASDTSKVNHERCTRCDAEPNYGSKRQIDYETETQFVVLTFTHSQQHSKTLTPSTTQLKKQYQISTVAQERDYWPPQAARLDNW